MECDHTSPVFPDLGRFLALPVVSEPVDELRCDRAPIPSAHGNQRRISFQRCPLGESKALWLTCSLDVAFFRIGSSPPALATWLIDDAVRTRAVITARPPRSVLGRVGLWRWHASVSSRVAWILGKIARRIRPRTFGSGGQRWRRIISCGYPGRRADGGGGGRQEIFLAHGLVRSFHLGPYEISKPLCNDLDILVPVHPAHIGLRTVFRGSLLKWKNAPTLKTVTSGRIAGQRRRRVGADGGFTLYAVLIPETTSLAFRELKLLVQPIPHATKRMLSGASHVVRDKESITSLRARFCS